MPLKRTTIYADADDLSVIGEAAVRSGVSRAEIIRDGIYLLAMRVQCPWEP
jgi:hypothetical protein